MCNTKIKSHVTSVIKEKWKNKINTIFGMKERNICQNMNCYSKYIQIIIRVEKRNQTKNQSTKLFKKRKEAKQNK